MLKPKATGKEEGKQAEQQQEPTNVNPTEGGPVSVPKQNIDYFTLKLHQNNDAAVYKMTKDDPSLNLTMMPEKDAYEKHKVAFEEAGQPITPEKFHEMYAGAKKQFAVYKQGMWDVGPDNPIYARRTSDVRSEAISPIPFDDTDYSFNYFPEDDTQFVMRDGAPRRVKTWEKSAFDRGIAVPVVGSNNLAEKFMGDDRYDPKNRTYVEKEVGGRKQEFIDLNTDFKKHWGEKLENYFPGPEGRTVLVAEADENGSPILVEKDIHEEVLGGRIMSAWGPQKMHSTWSENLVKSMIYNTAQTIPRNSVGLVDWIDDALEYGGSFLTGEPINPNGFWDDLDTETRNTTSWHSMKAPNDVSEVGWADNGRAFAWNSGAALGSVLQMVMTRKLSGAMGKTFGLSDEAANSFGAYMGSGTMAVTAADSFKQSMEENGIPDDMQILLYGGALVGSFAIERFGSNILDDGLSAFYAKKDVKDFISKEIRQSATDFGLSSASQMSKEQVTATGKKVFASILEKSKSLGGKAYDLTKRGVSYVSDKAPTSVKAAWEEGLEEVMEGRLYSSMETVTDWYQNYTKQQGKNLDRYNYIEDSDGKFYEVDTKTGVQRAITEQSYNKGLSGKEVRKGHGMFNEYNPENGFINQWTDHMVEGVDADFFLGAFAGGLVGTVQSLSNGRAPQRDGIIQEFVVTGRGDELRKEFAKNLPKGLFGDPDITPEGDPVDPNNPESKSINQLAYEAALQELSEAEQMFKLTGLPDSKALADMTSTTSGMTLLREAYDNMSKQMAISNEIKDINESIAQSEDSETIKNFEQDLADKQNSRQDLILQLNEIKDGTRSAERIGTGLIKKWANDNNFSMVAPDGSKFVPGVREYKNANDRFDKARTEALENIKEASQKRGKLETETAEFLQNITTAKTDAKSTEGMTDFFGKLSDIQKRSAEVGLSESNATKLVENLESYREDILSNIDQYFTEEQVKEAEAEAEGGPVGKEEILTSKMSDAPAGTMANSAYEWTKNIDEAINSFDIDEPGQAKVGDMVQWTIPEAGNQFDTPRKLEEITTDDNGNQFAKVEGTDTLIPIEQIHDPEFQGRRVVGSTPSEFNEDAFKNSFYDKYIDTEGNEVSISATISDLASRKMNDEDLRTIEFLDNAIKNNTFMAIGNNKALRPLAESDGIDLKKFKPSKESIVTDEQLTQIRKNLYDRSIILDAVKIKQQQDVNDRKNREGKIRYNDYMIRTDILKIVSNSDELSADIKNKLITLHSDLLGRIKEVASTYKDEGKYSRASLDNVDPLLVEAEDILHNELVGENSKKLIASLGTQFRNYKGASVKQPFPSYHEAKEFVMNEFDNSFTYDSFALQKSQGIETTANSARHQFSRLYFQNHLQSIERLSPKIFFEQYSTVLTEIEQDSGIVPSFEQKRNIHQTLAFMLNPDNGLLMDIESSLTDKSLADSPTKRDMLNRALFIRGFAGTGKTSLVIKMAANMYSNILGRKINIVTSAPSIELQSVINENLSGFRKNANQSGMTLNELNSFIAEKNSKIVDADLIIIDEASSINKSELDLLKKQLNAANLNPRLTILFLGDQSQMTSVSQTKFEHLAVERVMERTMPTTQVFRSGAADVSNLAAAYRNAIFRDEDAILPKGTYDKERNNGLQYFGKSKQEMYDVFIDDLNSGDEFKRNNTVLIAYTNADRDSALNYIKKRIDDPNMDVGSKIKAVEQGENYVQGLQFPRIMIAIEETDAKHLYNKAMYTSVGRANAKDDNHGYALVMSTRGYSEEGTPLVIETKTSSNEDIIQENNWVSKILGNEGGVESRSKFDGKSKLKEVSDQSFASLRSNLSSIVAPGKIQFNAQKFIIDGLTYRYTIKGKGVGSVTEKLESNIKKSTQEKPFTNQAHALRGTAIHGIVEAYLLKQQKTGGKLFTKKDITFLKSTIMQYNSEADVWNQTAKTEESKLSQINFLTDETIFEENDFVKDILNNVAKPIAERLNQDGKFTLPETIVGIYYNDIAGTIDIIDMVGLDGGIPVVDILDIKSLTPGSHQYFGDSDVKSKVDLGVLKLPSETVPANKLNKALSQLATYKAILENGDASIGLLPVKVRNVTIIKSMIDGNNNVSELKDADFVQRDSNGEEFSKFKEFGEKVVKDGVIPAEKDSRSYDYDNDMIGKMYWTGPREEDVDQMSIVEVTGFFTKPNGESFVELNSNTGSPMEVSKFLNGFTEYSSDPMKDPNEYDAQVLYENSALKYAAGFSFAYGSTSTYLQEGSTPRDSDHAKFKIAYINSIANSLRKTSPSSPSVDIVYHKTIELVNDNGDLQTSNDVLLVQVDDKSLLKMVTLAKELPWSEGMSNVEIITEIKRRGYDILGALPSPDSNFGVTEKGINYANDIEVEKLMSKIKDGFKKDGLDDRSKIELVSWHTHLAGLRAMGAKTEGGIVGNAKLAGVVPGSVKYDAHDRGFVDLKTQLTKKGHKVGDPYINNKLYQKKNSDGSETTVSSWAVDTWQISPSVDKSTIILKTGEFNDEHYTLLKKSISQLKANKTITPAEIGASLAMKFLHINRTFLIDNQSGQISSLLPALNEVLKVDGTELNLSVSGKITTAKLIGSLEKAIEILNDERKEKNTIAKSLRQAINYTTGDNDRIILPKGQESKLITSASDVHQFGFHINTKSINTDDITSVVNGVADKGESKNPLLDLMGKFNIDPDGPEGSSFMAEIDQDTYDSENNSETESDETSVTSDYYKYAKQYFGDIRYLNEVKKDVARIAIHFSNWNRDLKSPNYSIADMLVNTMNFYKEILPSIPTKITLEGQEFDDLSQISYESVHLLNDEQFGRFAYYVLGNDVGATKAVLQKLFPSLDMNNLSIQDTASNVSKKIVGDEDLSYLNENSQRTVMDNLEERDLTETLSAFVQWNLNHMPLQAFEINIKTNQVEEVNNQNRKVDPLTIHKVLIDAAQMSHWLTDETLGMDKIDRWAFHLLNIGLDAGPGTDTYNNVMTLYNTFFSDDPANMSHKYLRDNSISTPTNPRTLADDNQSLDASVVAGKGLNSDNLLSALYAQFLSVASKKSVDVHTKSRGEFKDYRQKTSSLAVGTHIAQAIKSRINSAIFGLNEGGLVVNDKVKDLLTGPNKVYDVKNNGVYNEDNVKLVEFIQDKGGKKISRFSIPEGVTVSDIKGMFNVFNIKELIYNKTINSYLNAEPGADTGSETAKDKDKLAEIIGMMMITGKLSVEPEWSGAPLAASYYKSNALTQDSLEELNDDESIDAEKIGEDLYKPSDLFRLIENISKVQSDIQLYNHARHFFSVDGKRIYRDTNGSYIYQLFPSGDISGIKPSSGIKKWFGDYVANTTDEDRQFNPLVNDDGKILNQLLDPNSNFTIEDIAMMGGTKSQDSAVRQGKGMIDLDYSENVINGLYFTDLLSGKKIQTVKLPYHNVADKANTPIFTYKFSDKIVFIKTFDSDGDFNGFEIDKEWRNEQIIKIFEYHNNARLTSYRKWADVLVNNQFVNNEGALEEINIDENTVDSWMKNPNSFLKYMNDIRSKFPDFTEIVKRSGLTETQDYKIEDGLIYPGKAPVMDIDNVYNYRNMQIIKASAEAGAIVRESAMYLGAGGVEAYMKAETQEEQNEIADRYIAEQLSKAGLKNESLTKVIDDLFHQRHMNTAMLLKDIGYNIHKDIPNKKLVNIVGKYPNGANIWKVNPSLDAFLYAYHIADHTTSQVVQGDTTQYKDSTDLFKRSSGPVAPKQVPDTASPRGIGKTSRVVIINDLNGIYEQLQTIFNKDGSHLKTDGLGIMNPISYLLLRNSYGGKDLGIIGDGMVKPQYFKNDLTLNDAIYFKYALLNITPETLRHSTIAQDTFRKMVTPEIFAMWESGQSFEEIAEYVINNGLRDDLIAQAVFTSSVKTGRKKMNNWNDESWEESIIIDNDYWGIQLNPTQDYEETDLSLPTQLIGQVGIGQQNKARVEEINNIKAEIASSGIKGIMNNFHENGIFKKEKFFDYVREMGISSALKNGEIAQFVEMLDNKNISLNIPSLGKVKQQFINRVTAETIKPKWNGVRMSQAPGLFFRIYKDENGNDYMGGDLEKHGVTPNNSRELQPMTFFSDPEFTNLISSREEFDQLIESGDVYVRPADIIMPFSYFKQFGLDSYIKEDPTFGLADVFSFRQQDGTLINLRSLPEDQLAELLQGEYSQMQQVKDVEYDTYIQREFSSPDKALEFLANFKETLKVINNRIPSSSTSSAFIGNVVGWINDNGNVVYTSAAKNILDGGDYDIDQLNVYFKSLDKDGKIITEGRKGKMNRVHDLMSGYFQDPKNIELFMSPIDMGSAKPGSEYGIRGSVKVLVDQLDKYVNDQNDFGNNLFYFDKIEQGSNLIGVFANVIKNYSYLSHSFDINPAATKNINVDPMRVDAIGQHIIDVLESFTNSAMDNVKELALGLLGATEDAGNIIGASAIEGMNVNEITDLLKNKAVQSVFHKVKYSKRVENKYRLSVLDAIDNKIEDLEEDGIEEQAELETERRNLMQKISNPDTILVETDITEDENGEPIFVNERQIRQIKEQIVDDAQIKVDQITDQLNNLKPYLQSQLDAMYKLKDLAFLGEAVSRMNTITKFDSQGIPVFDYKLDKQFRDIEFNLGMPMGDFLTGQQPGKDWFFNRKAYMDPTKIETFMLREKAIRGKFDLPGVINTLPHIKEDLRVVNEMKSWFSQSFLKSSKMVNDAVETFMQNKKLDWFPTEQAYYSFYKEMDNFMVALYFQSEFKSKRFQTLYGTTKAMSINVGTPEGRYQFGTEFPQYIMGILSKIDAKSENSRSEDEKALSKNLFLRTLTTREGSTGDYLEFKDSYTLGSEKYADLRGAFKKLPADMREKFHIYQLSKDGFSFSKGGLYEAMDNQLFVNYSVFLNTMEDAASEYKKGNDYEFELTDTEGNDIFMSFPEMLDVSFQKAVGFYSDGMSLLRRKNPEWVEENTPDQYKEAIKKGQYNVEYVIESATGRPLQAMTSRAFNGYDVTKDTMDDGQVLRKLTPENQKKIKSGQDIEVKFSSKPDYRVGPIRLLDGTLASIKMIRGNSLIIGPNLGTNKMELYQSSSNKQKVIQEIFMNTKNDLHKILANTIIQNTSANYLNTGKIIYTNELNDEMFKKAAEDGKKAYGRYEYGTMNIYINMDQVRGADVTNLLERTILHEAIHNYTSYALRISSDVITKLTPQERLDLDKAIKFKSDITKIFNAAKIAAKDQGLKIYGMKNVEEFVAEAYTNPEFQAFLGKVDTVEDLKTEGWAKSLYDSLIKAIRDLLGFNASNGYTALDQVIGVTNRFIEDQSYLFNSIRATMAKSGSAMMVEDALPIVEVNNSKDILNALQPTGVIKNFAQYKENEFVNTIYNSINTKDNSYYYNGERFFFRNDNGEPMSETQIRSKIENEIIPKFTEFETNYKDSVINWLSSGANEEGANPAANFPKKGGGSRYSPIVLADIKRRIDYDINDVFMRYSEFKGTGNTEIPFISEFEGYDPIIIVHKSIDDTSNSISIIDMTSLRLGKRGLLEGNLLKNFIENDKEANRLGVNLGNNEGDMRRLLLGLQAMAMKQANPDLKVKHIGALGVHKGGSDAAWVYMNEFVKNVEAIKATPNLYDSLPESIRNVIDDPALFEDTYDQPFVFMLKRNLEERLVELADIEGQSGNYKNTNEAIDKIEAYLNGEGSKQNMVDMLSNRMEYIQKTVSEEDIIQGKNTEYLYLSATLEELTSLPTFERTSTKDLDNLKSYYTPTHRIEHKIINWVQETVQDAMSYVSEQVSQFQVKKFGPALKSFNERYFQKHPEMRAMDYVQNLSGKKFENLFKKTTVRDSNGNDVEINMMEIHWDINADDTKQAIKANKITPKDVELGKLIVDEIESQMLQNLVHSKRYNVGKPYTLEDAKTELNGKWRRGMMPVMSASVNELLMKKDPKSIKAGFKKFWSKLSNIDDIYDEIGVEKKKDTKRQKILKEISDYFMNQIGTDSDIFGSDARMKLLGLRNDISGPVLFDAQANKNLSTNLELTTLYMVSSSTRKRHFDKKVLPVANAGQAMLANAAIVKLEGPQSNGANYLANFINATIKGQGQTLDSKVLNIDIDAAFNIALQVTSFSGLALNIPVGATSAVMNAGQFMNNAIANDFAQNGLYGKKDAFEAIKMYGTKDGREKIEGLMEMYKVADRSEQDMIHNPRRKVTNKNMFNSHKMHWFNWVTDYNVRGVVMASQMIKDGSMAAYSMKGGELVYDESKDPRWKSEDGKIIKEFIKERLVESGYMESVDDKMPRGYESKEADMLKYLADSRIIGSMDPMTQTQLSQMTLGKPFQQFASYLPDKLHNYFGSTKYDAKGGKWKVIRDENNVPKTVWEKFIVEGIFTSFVNLHSELRKNRYRSLNDMRKMTPTEKRNVGKFGMDMVSAAILYTLYAGLTGDWDDEEGDQAMVADSRFMRVFKYAALDYLIWNPMQFSETFSGIPVIEQAQRFGAMFVGDFSQIERTLPLSTTVRSIGELLPGDEE